MLDPGPLEPQGTLPGFGLDRSALFAPDHLRDHRAADEYLLFVALLPEADAADRLHGLAQGQRQRFDLHEPVVAAPRLHVTLQPIGLFGPVIPQMLVSAVVDAAAAAAAGWPALAIGFDRCGSMGHKAPTALALHCDAASQHRIAALRHRLSRTLLQRGLVAGKRAPPHMTLVYGTRHVAEHRIEPVRWQASQLSLVLSHRGRGHHQAIGSWPLR